MADKVLDISKTIRKRQNKEPVPELSRRVLNVLLDGDYSAVEQLAAVMLAGRSLRLAYVEQEGEETVKKLVANAFNLAKVYDIHLGGDGET